MGNQKQMGKKHVAHNFDNFVTLSRFTNKELKTYVFLPIKARFFKKELKMYHEQPKYYQKRFSCFVAG